MSESLRTPLLLAACRVLAKRGTSALTLDAVAAEAGASKGGVLYHFPSKNALIEAMLTEVITDFEQTLERHLRHLPEGPGRYLRAYVLASTEELPDEEAEIGSAILALVTSDPSWARVYWPAVERWRARATDDGIDPAFALVVMAAADGLGIWDAMGVGVAGKETRRDVVLRLLDAISSRA